MTDNSNLASISILRAAVSYISTEWHDDMLIKVLDETLLVADPIRARRGEAWTMVFAVFLCQAPTEHYDSVNEWYFVVDLNGNAAWARDKEDLTEAITDELITKAARIEARIEELLNPS